MRKNFVIPALFNAGNEMVPWDKYPDAIIFGDNILAQALGTTPSSISVWKKKGVIPFTQRRGYCEYRVLDVVKSLRDYGYGQDIPDNPIPTGVSQQQYPPEK